MLSLKSRKDPMGKTVSLRKCLLLLFLRLKCSGNWWCETSETDSAETSRQANHQTRANVSQGDLTKFRPTVEVRWILQYSASPQTGGTWQLSLTRKVTCHSSPLCSNTNTDSRVLVPDIFNYLMSTFIFSHLPLYGGIDAFLLFIFRAQMYFRGGDGGDDHNHFIQLLCKCFRFL